MLNRYDRPSPMAGEAEVKYLDGDFRIVRPGAFVRCAVTGVPIPLEELKYWSVDLQEAYASPEAVLQRLHPAAGQVATSRVSPRRQHEIAERGSSSATASVHRQRPRDARQRREIVLRRPAAPGPFRWSPARGRRARRAAIRSSASARRIAVMIGEGTARRAPRRRRRAASRRISPDRRCRRRPAPAAP